MNMIQAARETIELAAAHGMQDSEFEKPELNFPHLVEMLEKMEAGGMSEAKVGRWLGWMQAAVVCSCDDVSIEDMKEINRRNAD